ncbi:MAG: 16S rRNA (cytosine(1402)-N(4))-methyltransferase RsmH, partial [Clostridia bacterium]|nr:16S rRNA (cytosine(1402)-N(4))-methyltransferase RsmH [Clostridia bacterium]
IVAAQKRLSCYGRQIKIVKNNFVNIKEVVYSLNIEKVDGVLLDIGVSSHQLDEKERGFSYMADAPLDMRMDTNSASATAADLVNSLGQEELANLIYKYGEERYSRRIAARIVEARQKKRIETTFELVDLIKKAMPKGKYEDQHPAKRTFQALRIAVNDELNILDRALEDILTILKTGGRVAVITFHSLEDRIVKDKFKTWAKGCTCPPEFPVCICGKKPVIKLITRKPIVAGKEELENNHRSRSAKLRVAERL